MQSAPLNNVLRSHFSPRNPTWPASPAQIAQSYISQYSVPVLNVIEFMFSGIGLKATGFDYPVLVDSMNEILPNTQPSADRRGIAAENTDVEPLVADVGCEDEHCIDPAGYLVTLTLILLDSPEARSYMHENVLGSGLRDFLSHTFAEEESKHGNTAKVNSDLPAPGISTKRGGCR